MTTTAKKPTSRRVASTREGGERKRFINHDSSLTVEQWNVLPDTKPRYELVDGKLVQKMTTTTEHAWAVGQLLFTLMSWGKPRGWTFLPEGTGVKMAPFDGAVPDIIGLSPDTVPSPKATIQTQPFLLVEVISRGTAKADRTRKKELYAQIGVQLYLIVDPIKKMVEVFTLQDAAYATPRVLASDEVWQPEELAGLRLETQKLWMS